MTDDAEAELERLRTIVRDLEDAAPLMMVSHVESPHLREERDALRAEVERLREMWPVVVAAEIWRRHDGHEIGVNEIDVRCGCLDNLADAVDAYHKAARP